MAPRQVQVNSGLRAGRGSRHCERGFGNSNAHVDTDEDQSHLISTSNRMYMHVLYIKSASAISHLAVRLSIGRIPQESVDHVASRPIVLVPT